MQVSSRLSILYLRCIPRSEAIELEYEEFAFNSLFEMRLKKLQYGIGITTLLSILYLRCATTAGAVTVKAATTFQFSI